MSKTSTIPSKTIRTVAKITKQIALLARLGQSFGSPLAGSSIAQKPLDLAQSKMDAINRFERPS